MLPDIAINKIWQAILYALKKVKVLPIIKDISKAAIAYLVCLTENVTFLFCIAGSLLARLFYIRFIFPDVYEYPVVDKELKYLFHQM